MSILNQMNQRDQQNRREWSQLKIQNCERLLNYLSKLQRLRKSRECLKLLRSHKRKLNLLLPVMKMALILDLVLISLQPIMMVSRLLELLVAAPGALCNVQHFNYSSLALSLGRIAFVQVLQSLLVLTSQVIRVVIEREILFLNDASAHGVASPKSS